MALFPENKRPSVLECLPLRLDLGDDWVDHCGSGCTVQYRGVSLPCKYTAISPSLASAPQEEKVHSLSIIPTLPVKLHLCQLGSNRSMAATTTTTTMVQPTPLHFLISGAGRGIGRGLTRLLLAKGHRVFLIDNNKAELEHTVATHLHPSFSENVFQSSLTNIRSPSEIKSAVKQAATFFNNKLDVLINNAAFTGSIGAVSKFEDLSLDDWNNSLETNLTGPMLLSQACVPLLRSNKAEGREHGGTIIHMSSTRARQSEPHSEAYAATKAGLIGLTHAMASSLAGDGITVNAILPGWINVMNETKDADEQGTRWEDGLSEEEHAWHFSGRVGKVEDVLGAVEFLARERFVNGTEIVLDGGVTRKMVYPE